MSEISKEAIDEARDLYSKFSVRGIAAALQRHMDATARAERGVAELVEEMLALRERADKMEDALVERALQVQALRSNMEGYQRRLRAVPGRLRKIVEAAEASEAGCGMDAGKVYMVLSTLYGELGDLAASTFELDE